MASYPTLSTELTQDSPLDISTAAATEIVGGKPIDARRLTTFSATVRVLGLTGGTDATVKLQATDVLNYTNPAYEFPAPDDDDMWVDVSSGSVTLSATGDNVFTFSVNDLPQAFIRVVFTKNTATGGTVEAFVTCKNG